jgi:hypothetical protein
MPQLSTINISYTIFSRLKKEYKQYGFKNNRDWPIPYPVSQNKEDCSL